MVLSESRDGLANEEKKLLLERYGYDANEFVSELSPKVLSACVLKFSFYSFLFFDRWIFFSIAYKLTENHKGEKILVVFLFSILKMQEKGVRLLGFFLFSYGFKHRIISLIFGLFFRLWSCSRLGRERNSKRQEKESKCHQRIQSLLGQLINCFRYCFFFFL